MNRLLLALLAGVALLMCGVLIGQAQEPAYKQVGCAEGDVTQNGHCTVADAIVLMQNAFLNPEWADGIGENPCVQYVTYSDSNPAPFPIVNSLGEMVPTPRGGMFLIPSWHPAYVPLMQNDQAWPLRVCTGG